MTSIEGEGIVPSARGPLPTSPHVPTDEPARLAAVRRYRILDTPPDGAFDRVAALAARLLSTPIATVTIVDEDRIWFKAAHGLEGVAQVPRDPGLCASAILDSTPYVVTDAATDPRTLNNSLVRGELGLRFYAAAPITTADGHRLGTVNVIDTVPREIDEEGLAHLSDLAAIVMDQLELRLSAIHTVAVERRLRSQAQATARALQNTLLPPRLPVVPGLEVASHYHAASPEQVGGDFYDLFALGEEGDRWALFIGDVQGKGVDAAAVTSLARYTLRASAIREVDPATALDELNAAILLDSDEDTRFCTAVYAELQRDGEGYRVELANGGHPPALVLRAGGTVEQIHAPGMLIGALPEVTYTNTSVRLGPGDVMLLYTDGITDVRPHGGPRFGEDAFAAFLTSCAGCGPTQVIDRVLALIDEISDGPSDDIALLVLGVPRG